MSAIAQAGFLFAAFVVGWVLKSFMPSYFGEKGKNLATKEDIEEITKKIESVKSAVGSRLHIYQVRYEHEFKILVELTEKLVAAREAAHGLRPEVSYGDIKDPEVRKKRMGRYIDAAQQLYVFVETHQPFMPPEIYQAMKMLDQVSWKEFVQFKHMEPNMGAKDWENAIENGANIGNISAAAILLIRQRIQRWDAFDPGP